MSDGVIVSRGPTGITYQPAIRVSCTYALGLGAIEGAIHDMARTHLTEPIRIVRTMGSYGCRMIQSVRSPGRLSEHSFGNAIDVGELRGTAIRASVLRDFRADTVEGRFLRALSQRLRQLASLDRVLDPDYNAAHRNHLHLEGRSLSR
jgi:hypothetical protein